jgi:phenylpropionate dioxygenase-like ring-hydroxylating dioxygenase large terminal subunit
MQAAENIERYGRRWTLDYPELGTGPVSIEPYLSQEYFDRERDTIFRRSWLNVGREEQIPAAGDYFVQEIPNCDVSILLVRGKDGVIRGFHNVCAHRMNKLVWTSEGSCQSFRCKFHGWSYDSSGQLRGVPDEETFYDLDKKKRGLSSVAVEIWQGFIFLNLDPNPQESLLEYLGEMGERLAEFPFKDMTACYAYRGELKANWKLGVSAFNEVYHLGSVHSESGRNTFRDKDNMFGRPLWTKLDKRHHTLSMFANPDFDMTPVEEVVTGLAAPQLFQGDVGYGRGANPSGAKNWFLDINVIFPNFFVDVASGWYFTYNFWPLSPDRTFYEVKNYYAPPRNASERFSHEYSRALLRDVLQEDLHMIEQSHAGMVSAPRRDILLSDSEVCVRHHLKVVDDHVGRTD